MGLWLPIVSDNYNDFSSCRWDGKVFARGRGRGLLRISGPGRTGEKRKAREMDRCCIELFHRYLFRPLYRKNVKWRNSLSDESLPVRKY